MSILGHLQRPPKNMNRLNFLRTRRLFIFRAPIPGWRKGVPELAKLVSFCLSPFSSVKVPSTCWRGQADILSGFNNSKLWIMAIGEGCAVPGEDSISGVRHSFVTCKMSAACYYFNQITLMINDGLKCHYQQCALPSSLSRLICRLAFCW